MAHQDLKPPSCLAKNTGRDCVELRQASTEGSVSLPRTARCAIASVPARRATMHRALSRTLRALTVDWNDADVARTIFPYELGRCIARGRFALVFDARSTVDGQRVVLKIPSAEVDSALIPTRLTTKVECLRH